MNYSSTFHETRSCDDDDNDIYDETIKVPYHDVNQKKGSAVVGAAGNLHLISDDHDDDDDDDEEHFEQSVGNFVTPAASDYREAVTLSLLVAEDILPRPLYRNSNRRRRRVSIIGRFSGNSTSRTTHDSERNEKESSSNENIQQKRRHSCSVMTDIEEKMFIHLK